jgi:hypothetical protein
MSTSRDKKKAVAPPGSGVPPVVLKMAQLVNLEAVRLYRASAHFFGITEGESLAEMDVKLEAGGRKMLGSTDLLQIFIGATFKFRPSTSSTKVLARVVCRFALDYRVADEVFFKSLTDTDIEAFARINGVHNAWPYMREYCQSTLGRMQLPGVVLPSRRANHMMLERPKRPVESIFSEDED